MTIGTLEHVNITVGDPLKTAEWLGNVFGWKVRWKGAAIHGGTTVHVGSDDQYLAVYSGPGEQQGDTDGSYFRRGGLNHVGVVVDDLDATERRVTAQGFAPEEAVAQTPAGGVAWTRVALRGRPVPRAPGYSGAEGCVAVQVERALYDGQAEAFELRLTDPEGRIRVTGTSWSMIAMWRTH